MLPLSFFCAIYFLSCDPCVPCCRYQSSPPRSLPCPRHDSLVSVTNRQTCEGKEDEALTPRCQYFLVDFDLAVNLKSLAMLYMVMQHHPRQICDGGKIDKFLGWEIASRRPGKPRVLTNFWCRPELCWDRKFVLWWPQDDNSWEGDTSRLNPWPGSPGGSPSPLLTLSHLSWPIKLLISSRSGHIEFHISSSIFQTARTG